MLEGMILGLENSEKTGHGSVRSEGTQAGNLANSGPTHHPQAGRLTGVAHSELTACVPALGGRVLTYKLNSSPLEFDVTPPG